MSNELLMANLFAAWHAEAQRILAVAVREAVEAERAAERARVSDLARRQIATYRRNAELCPNRKPEFDGLAESLAGFEAVVLELYDGVRVPE